MNSEATPEMASTPVPTNRIAVSAAGLQMLNAIAQQHGVSARQYLEALVHYAIFCDRRPRSGAQGFDFDNYDLRSEGAFAGRWFT